MCHKLAPCGDMTWHVNTHMLTVTEAHTLEDTNSYIQTEHQITGGTTKVTGVTMRVTSVSPPTTAPIVTSKNAPDNSKNRITSHISHAKTQDFDSIFLKHT